MTLTCPNGTYAEAMRKARQTIDLYQIGIENLRFKKAVTSAFIIEIQGKEAQLKAEALKERLADTVGRRDGVRVAYPVKTVELRLHKVEDSVAQGDIVDALKVLNGAPGQITVGHPHRTANGLYTVWIRCPVAVANAAIRAGQVKVGCLKVRVEELCKRLYIASVV